MSENDPAKNKKIPSGDEVIRDFFENLIKVTGLDQVIADTLQKLFQEGELKKQTILDAMRKLRGEE